MSAFAEFKRSYIERKTAIGERAIEIAVDKTIDAEPEITGALKGYTGSQRVSNTQDLIAFDIYANTEYASYVDGGTRGPYRIFPRRGKMLRFNVAGVGTVFARSVLHPGIKAQHFFKKPMPKRWSEAVERAANEVQL